MTPRANGYCVHHDPTITEAQRREWFSRGGLRSVLSRSRLPENLPRPDLATPESIKALLEETVGHVRGGQVSPAQANSIKGLVDSALKLFELALAAEVERNLREEHSR